MGEARRRLSYANVTATLALFVALGGSSYAAFKLPRDSVGRAELRRDSVAASELRRAAVRSPEVRNGSLGAFDLSARARRTLTGQQGERGPAGEPASKFWAFVRADGSVVRATPPAPETNVSHAAGSGRYRVFFPTTLERCSYLATLEPDDANLAVAPGYVSVHLEAHPGPLAVETYGTDGRHADRSFHVAALC